MDDNHLGNRNADLAGWGSFGPTRRRENFSFTIEAKADEKFEDSVRVWKENRIRKSLRSGAPERLKKLSEGLFGRKPDDAIESLQYQLLPAFAGTAVLGKERRATRSILVIHEFVSLCLDFDKVIDNSVALAEFVQQIPGWENAEVKCGSLLPWIRLQGNEWIPNDLEVSIGKVRTLIPLGSGGRVAVSPLGNNRGQFIELK
ncbi:DUF6946 family protein [Bremerella alba]|uniref:DUF6946 family protein n=1 Tax=Bremerella alba TaxID=980252 RepID=UPI0036F25591